MSPADSIIDISGSTEDNSDDDKPILDIVGQTNAKTLVPPIRLVSNTGDSRPTAGPSSRHSGAISPGVIRSPAELYQQDKLSMNRLLESFENNGESLFSAERRRQFENATRENRIRRNGEKPIHLVTVQNGPKDRRSDPPKRSSSINQTRLCFVVKTLLA